MGLEEPVNLRRYVSVPQLNPMTLLIVVLVIYVRIPNFVIVSISLRLGIEEWNVPQVELVRLTRNVRVLH